jgi:hypothetical protein
VPFHLTGRGTTTRPMGQADGNPVFTIDLNFVDHQLRISTPDGRAVAIAHPHPFDLPDADRWFADDTEHASYDPAWASRSWMVLSQVNLVLEEFAGRFSGKASPGAPLLAHLRPRPHPLCRTVRSSSRPPSTR